MGLSKLYTCLMKPALGEMEMYVKLLSVGIGRQMTMHNEINVSICKGWIQIFASQVITYSGGKQEAASC